MANLGAEIVLDYRQDWDRRMRHVRPEFILDTVGGALQDRSLRLLRPGGTLVTVAGPANQGLAAQLGVHAYFVGVRENGARLAQIAALADAARLRPHTMRVVPLEHAVDAIASVAGGHARGKTVVTIA